MPTKKISPTPNQLPVPAELIERRIYVIREQKVMLDSDLAELYEVPTKALNRPSDAILTASLKTSCFNCRRRKPTPS